MPSTLTIAGQRSEIFLLRFIGGCSSLVLLVVLSAGESSDIKGAGGWGVAVSANVVPFSGAATGGCSVLVVADEGS